MPTYSCTYNQMTHLGGTLDQTLSYHQLAENVADKTATRVNLLRKLSGHDWVANFSSPHWHWCMHQQNTASRLEVGPHKKGNT